MKIKFSSVELDNAISHLSTKFEWRGWDSQAISDRIVSEVFYEVSLMRDCATKCFTIDHHLIVEAVGMRHGVWLTFWIRCPSDSGVITLEVAESGDDLIAKGLGDLECFIHREKGHRGKDWWLDRQDDNSITQREED